MSESTCIAAAAPAVAPLTRWRLGTSISTASTGPRSSMTRWRSGSSSWHRSSKPAPICMRRTSSSTLLATPQYRGGCDSRGSLRKFSMATRRANTPRVSGRRSIGNAGIQFLRRVLAHLHRRRPRAGAGARARGPARRGDRNVDLLQRARALRPRTGAQGPGGADLCDEVRHYKHSIFISALQPARAASGRRVARTLLRRSPRREPAMGITPIASFGTASPPAALRASTPIIASSPLVRQFHAASCTARDAHSHVAQTAAAACSARGVGDPAPRAGVRLVDRFGR